MRDGAETTGGAEWLDGAKAAAILGVPDGRTVARLADRGLIGRRNLPGVRARYRASDVRALAEGQGQNPTKGVDRGEVV